MAEKRGTVLRITAKTKTLLNELRMRSETDDALVRRLIHLATRETRRAGGVAGRELGPEPANFPPSPPESPS